MYISVPTREISKAVQEYLFSLGYEWYVVGRLVCTNHPYLRLVNGYIYGVTICDETCVSLHEIKPVKPPLVISGYLVLIDDKIKIGNIEITKEGLQALYDRVFN